MRIQNHGTITHGCCQETSGLALIQYVCPDGGAYYDIYDDWDKQDIFEFDNLDCRWCNHKMNLISTGDMEVLGTVYLLVGEFRDRLWIADVLVKGNSGIGFVSGAVRPTYITTGSIVFR